MPRKYTKKPRRVMRRKATGKKMAIARAYKKANLQRHISRQPYSVGAVTNFSYNVTYNGSFALNQLATADVTAIQQLYTFYRIDAVKLEFFPNWNSAAGVNLQPELNLARLTMNVETDPTSISTTENQILEHRNAKSLMFTRKLSKYMKVQPATIVEGVSPENPGISQNGDRTRNWWLPTNTPGVPHFGIDFGAYTMSGVINEAYYRVIATYYITFKGQR